MDIGYSMDILHINVLVPIQLLVNDPGDMVCHIKGMATLISNGKPVKGTEGILQESIVVWLICVTWATGERVIHKNIFQPLPSI